MSRITLTKSDRTKIYLKEYYGSKRPFTKYIRLFAGPLILLISVYNYYYSDVKWISSLSGFTIVFGIYYILKPFIITLAKPQLFVGYSFDIEILSNKIKLTEDGATSELPFSFFQEVTKRDTFYALKTDKNQVLHLPIDQLDSEEISKLDSLISKSTK